MNIFNFIPFMSSKKETQTVDKSIGVIEDHITDGDSTPSQYLKDAINNIVIEDGDRKGHKTSEMTKETVKEEMTKETVKEIVKEVLKEDTKKTEIDKRISSLWISPHMRSRIPHSSYSSDNLDKISLSYIIYDNITPICVISDENKVYLYMDKLANEAMDRLKKEVSEVYKIKNKEEISVFIRKDISSVNKLEHIYTFSPIKSIQ